MSLIYRIKGVRKLYLLVQNVVFNLWYKKRLGNNVKIFGLPLIDITRGAHVNIGKNVTLCSSFHFNEPGINHPVIIRLLCKEAKLTIGNNTGISGGSICVQKEVSIGNDVLMGANVSIVDTDFHPVAPENRRRSKKNVGSAKIVVEDNVFLGMNSIILKGVNIGKNSIIAAGSVVTKNVPSNQIWGGNPARFIKQLPETPLDAPVS